MRWLILALLSIAILGGVLMTTQSNNLERIQQRADDAFQREDDLVRQGTVTQVITAQLPSGESYVEYDVEVRGRRGNYTIHNILADQRFYRDSGNTLIGLQPFSRGDNVWVSVIGGDLRRGALIVGKVGGAS